jgi:transposase
MDGKDDIIRALQEQNRALQEQVRVLTARVTDLERRLNLNSSNSSKPPSSDGLSKKLRTGSLRKKGRHKPGGQKGHPGKTLEMSLTPDTVIVQPVTNCKDCGKDLVDVKSDQEERRQVFDIPKPRVEVTEYRSEQKICSCGVVTKGLFPEHVAAPVQYGPRTRAMSVYFNHQQLIPEDRVADIFADIFSLPLAAATVASYGNAASNKLQPWLMTLYQWLATHSLKHLDETGFRIAGKTLWLHVICNASATFYRIAAKRGEMFKGLSGVIVHDHFRSYYTLLDVLHALCNSHHLRELKALSEIEKESWAIRMTRLLRYANKHRDKADMVRLIYDRIVTSGLSYHESQPPLSTVSKRGRKKRRIGHNLLLRLRGHQDEVLRFLESDDFPFTNNCGEQALRMMKLRMKISGCFRSFPGAEVFANIRSFTSTCRKQEINVFSALEDLFQGTLPALLA